MNKDIYKKAMDDITVDQALINKIINRATDNFTGIKRTMFRHYIAAAACIVIVITGVIAYKYFAPNNQDKNNALLSQINKYYVAYNIKAPSVGKYPLPYYPANGYLQLKYESNAVILCTVGNVGVYQRKGVPINLKGGFGIYIYTVKIDKILSGNIDEKAGSNIPISENAYVGYKSKNGKPSNEINFYPYTLRARTEDAATLEAGKQYIMFLSKKDETGCYHLPFTGFGVFSIDYINKTSQNYTLDELKKKYNYVEIMHKGDGYVSERTDNELKDDNLYKICSLHVKEDFLR